MPSSVKIYFVRHGQTAFSQAGRCQGWTDLPILEEEKVRLQALGQGLKAIRFAGVYTSDLKRTIQTAEIILAENQYQDQTPVTSLPALREVNFGGFEGEVSQNVWPEVHRQALEVNGLLELRDLRPEHILNMTQQLDPTGQAENFIVFWKRLEGAILEMMRQHRHHPLPLLVVCHGTMLRYLLYELVSDFDLTFQSIPYGSVSIVEYKGDRFSLLDYCREYP